MKIGGVLVTPPEDGLLVIPRGKTNIVFRARALDDWEEFNAICPTPKPPGVLTKNGFEADPKDKGYQDILLNHALQKIGYMVIRSLEPSNIEWDKVSLKSPKTWTLWEKELKAAGLMQFEINRVYEFVTETNSLTEEKLEKARADFLHGQAEEAAKSSGLLTEPASTPSGTPATEQE